MFAVQGKSLRILRAADEEALTGPPPRRLDEQRLERRLPVGRIGAEIGEVGSEIGPCGATGRWISGSTCP